MELTKMQESFFENSKMRTSKGELTHCYHWTKNEFSEFDPSTISNESGDNGYFGKGFYFTGNKQFNSCCFLYPEEEAAGKKKIQLDCYLDIKNPLRIEDLGKSEKEDLLRYIKDHADYAPEVVASEEDFVSYLSSQGYYNDYADLIEQYNSMEINFCDKVEGLSLDDLYYQMEWEEKIITPDRLTFRELHRGLLIDYSALITEYAKSQGFDGIVSDNADRPVEIVVFEPNQIKAVDNLYPTESPNFKDNLSTLSHDFSDFSRSERIRIANNLLEYQKVLPQKEFDSLCDSIAKDSDKFVREAMARQGFTNGLENDPSPVVREAVEEQRKMHDFSSKRETRDKGIDI